MENRSIAAIEHIKRKLDLNEMSVLVGAGFSKNIDDDAFLSWDKLLEPMVLFLFNDEIELAYNSMISGKYKKKKQDFISERIGYYINKVGYTKLVTLYAERKGHLESITTYVEEHTPWIKANSKGEKKLVMGQSRKLVKKLTSEMLNQHELLINLNWNNIYTTNYDNALEVLLDQEGKEELNKKCKLLLEEINNLELDIVTNEKKYLKLKSKLDTLLLKKSSNDSNKDNIPIDKISENKTGGELIDSEVESLRPNVFDLSMTLSSKKNKLKKLRQNFILLDNAYHDVISIVTKSSELSLKKNRNIIKLHGNLRFNETDKNQYGFDGDNRTQYIFSEDSYKEYPVKHEAFTNLMRISLLQESFLLIGFSGVDPNFTEWIKWVRDVVEVKESKGNEKKVADYKIYFIDLSNAHLDEDLKLYYENHNIFRIELSDNEVISFLEKNTFEITEPEKSYKYKINLFLKYLTRGISSLSIKLALRQYDNNQITTLFYDLIYSRLRGNDHRKLFIDFAKKIEGKEDLIKNIIINPGDTTPFISLLQELYKKHIQQSLEDLNHEDKRFLLKSICLVLDILNIPLFIIFNDEEQQTLKKDIEETKDKHLIKSFLVIWEKQYVLCDESKLINDRYKAYNLMYQLKFDQLSGLISEWKTDDNEENLFAKLSIQYLFDNIKLSDYLSFENTFIKGNINTYLKYLQLAKVIADKEILYSGILDKTKNDKFKHVKLSIDSKIEYLIKNGVLDAEHKMQAYINQIVIKQKIERYGKNRFSTSKTIHIGNAPEERMKFSSIQYLYLLQEYTNSLHIINVDSNQWYRLTRLLLSKYHSPIIFYSLCIGNKDLLKRLSNDLCFHSAKLSIFKSLIDAFKLKNLPQIFSNRFEENLIILISEMLHCIDLKEWESFFNFFWKLHKDKILENSSRFKEYTDFIYISVQYVADLEMFILDLLEKIEDIHYDDKYRVLPELVTAINKNDNIKLTSRIEQSFNQIFSNSHIEKKNNIWIISSCMFDKMNPSLKTVLKRLIKNVDFEKNMSDNYYSDIVFKFSNRDKKLKQQFEDVVFTPQRLWNTGYSEKGGGYSRERIGILFFLPYFKAQLEAAIKEKSPKIDVLYKSINETYTQIVKLLEFALVFDSFDTQIRNVIFFLSILKENIQDLSDISLVDIEQHLMNFQKIASVAVSNNDIKTMLLSGNREDFNKSLEAINYEIFQLKKELSDFKPLIDLVFGKIITSNNEEIEGAFVYIAKWLLEKKNEFVRLFRNEIFLLLEKYSNYDTISEELDKIYVTQNLVIVAVILSQHNDFKNSFIVQDFIRKSKELNFNIINKAIKDVEKKFANEIKK